MGSQGLNCVFSVNTWAEHKRKQALHKIACNYHTQQLCASNYFKLVTIYKNRMELRLLFSEGDSKFFTLFAVQLNLII